MTFRTVKWTHRATTFASAFVFAFVAGCGEEGGSMGRGKGAKGGEEGSGNGTEATPEQENEAKVNACVSTMKSYKGFGNVELTTSRLKAVEGADRFRVKPYSALAGEFERVIGNAPYSLDANQDTFVSAPDRWYVEPRSSAVSLYASFRVGFDAALKFVAANAKFNQAPTEATAAAECAAFERKAWSRTPTPEEIDACKTVALADTQSEANAQRRWAYTFASVLGAAGFTTY